MAKSKENSIYINGIKFLEDVLSNGKTPLEINTSFGRLYLEFFILLSSVLVSLNTPEFELVKEEILRDLDNLMTKVIEFKKP